MVHGQKNKSRRRVAYQRSVGILWGLVFLVIVFSIWYCIVYPRMVFNVKKERKYTIVVGETENPFEITCKYTSLSGNKEIDIPLEAVGNIDTSTLGSYKVKYMASHAGVHKHCEVVYTVVDRQPPQLELNNNKLIIIEPGSVYVDPGFSAIDNYDGNLNDRVEISGEVNCNQCGEYTLTYSVSDTSGNQTEKQRTVMVADKIVYLTFDDGPGQYTDKLLDILEEYHARATFFVTNQFPKYQSCIGRAFQNGNTIAVHSATHQTASVYASPAAYWNDFEKMNDICKEQTGENCKIFRFPGGSSNSVSNKYCEGIVNVLVEESKEKDLWYCDWNADSGDASTAKTKEEVYENVISSLENHKTRVVLLHDIHDYTVDAIPYILEWGRENGYLFLPLTREEEMVHHR